MDWSIVLFVQAISDIMNKFKFMDPEMIMTIVVSLIILAVGVFAFFVVIGNTTDQMGVVKPTATTSTQSNQSYYQWQNTSNNISATGNSVFNIIGIVLIIGAIMAIVGLVYSYTQRGGM